MRHQINAFFNTLGESLLFSEADKAERKLHGALNIIIFIVLTFGAMALGAFLLKAIFAVPEGTSLDDADVPGPMILIGLFLPGWFAVAAWVKYFEKRPILSIGLNQKAPGKELIKGWLYGVGLMAAIVIINWLAGGYELRWAQQQIPTIAILTSIAVLLLAFFIQSGAEEIWLRGWLMPVLGTRHSKKLAIILPIVAFILLHGWSPERPLYTSFSLLFFTCLVTFIALRDGSIAGIMGLHTGWNWSAGQLFGLNITSSSFGTESIFKFTPTGNVLLSGGAGGPEWSFSTLIVLTLALAWTVRGIYLNGVNKAPSPEPIGKPLPSTI